MKTALSFLWAPGIFKNFRKHMKSNWFNNKRMHASSASFCYFT
jgi:hypothetical protein